MTIKKEGTLNQVKIFALTQLSSWLYRNHRVKSIKSMALEASCSPTTLSGIKNGTIKCVSLNRTLDIMDRLNINYVMQVQRRRGVTHYSFAMDKYNVRKSSSAYAEVEYKDEFDYARRIANKTE